MYVTTGKYAVYFVITYNSNFVKNIFVNIFWGVPDIRDLSLNLAGHREIARVGYTDLAVGL